MLYSIVCPGFRSYGSDEMMDGLSAGTLVLHRGERWILRDVSHTLCSGTVFALVGRSGSGLSALLRCLAGL